MIFGKAWEADGLNLSKRRMFQYVLCESIKLFGVSARVGRQGSIKCSSISGGCMPGLKADIQLWSSADLHGLVPSQSPMISQHLSQLPSPSDRRLILEQSVSPETAQMLQTYPACSRRT